MILQDTGSFIASFLPVSVLIWLLWYTQKQKNEKKNRRLGLGRKGKKDHLWHIVKEWMRINGISGLEIEKVRAFERPKPHELHKFMEKTANFKARLLAKEQGVKYRRPEIPDRYPQEDYFEALEEETKLLNKHLFSPCVNSYKSHRADAIQKKDYDLQNRKRYLIVFKTRNSKTGEISKWISLDAELFPNTDPDSKYKDKVVINKETDYEQELAWMLPLQMEKDRASKKR
ncbi:hypothetical protein MHF_0767 [Mycoplasma haemofelis Ohio2]|uniref:Uncharacterized protein n=1 Tax=Mycoplasma haemofelis (strain Ohio2) TaxID=859194 RepID=F6FII8_MYCHI|nr:hypothetical protein MHF_0767 [Mycoplasma haemofelis Ohio2]